MKSKTVSESEIWKMAIKTHSWRFLSLLAGLVSGLSVSTLYVAHSLDWIHYTNFSVYWVGLAFSIGVSFTYDCWKMDRRSTEESDADYAVLSTYFATKRWRIFSLVAAVLASLLAVSQIMSVPSEAGWAFAIAVCFSTICWVLDRRYMSALEDRLPSD